MADIKPYEYKPLKDNPYFEVEKVLANFQKYNTYMMTGFQDRIVELPWTFVKKVLGVTEEGNEIIKLEFHEGEIIEEGTDLSEMNLGNVDVAVAILYEWRRYIDNFLLQLALKTDGLEMTTLNGMIANAFGVSFDTLENIKIIRGYYDETRGEVWS